MSEWLWAGAIWVGASAVMGLVAGRFLAMTNPDPQPPDRRFWDRRGES